MEQPGAQLLMFWAAQPESLLLAESFDAERQRAETQARPDATIASTLRAGGPWFERVGVLPPAALNHIFAALHSSR